MGSKDNKAGWIRSVKGALSLKLFETRCDEKIMLVQNLMGGNNEMKSLFHKFQVYQQVVFIWHQIKVFFISDLV